MPVATAPNAAIPAGLAKRTFDAVPAGVKGHAAGVLFVAPDGDVLLCRRSSSEENYAGHWALPGGKAEDGESPTRAAARESVEELGGSLDPKGLKLLDRKVTPTGIVFHTFARPVATKFQPRINEEHSGFGWYGLHELPSPLHPGVAGTLKDRLGISEDAADMSEEDWRGLRDGFLKWTQEEEAETEHAQASDALAFDRSMRSFDEDGRMLVEITNISKAQVSPYKGREIPGWDDETETHALGLDPNQTYMMLRDPDELKKSVRTWDGIQVLKEHIPVDADDHQKDEIVGTTLSNTEFSDPYLRVGMRFWAQEGIDLVESEQQREISSGYHYNPDMTPGIFRGEKYDGVMRNIRGNHVIICEEGRAGPDVLVADSLIEYQWGLVEDAVINAWSP